MIITNRVVLNEKEHDLSMLIDINIRAVIAICFPRVIEAQQTQDVLGTSK